MEFLAVDRILYLPLWWHNLCWRLLHNAWCNTMKLLHHIYTKNIIINEKILLLELILEKCVISLTYNVLEQQCTFLRCSTITIYFSLQYKHENIKIVLINNTTFCTDVQEWGLMLKIWKHEFGRLLIDIRLFFCFLQQISSMGLI